MPSVGTAYVDIKVDTKAFDAGLKKALAKAAGKSVDIKVKIDVDDAAAEAALKKIKKSAASAAGEVDIDVDVDEADAEADLEKIKALAIACGKDIDIKVDVDDSDAGPKLVEVAKNVNKSASGLNVFTGRLGAIADAILVLSPAIAAVGAVAVPAVTAIGQAIGGLAVGAGTAVLAFKGVGDAVGAMNAAALEPSAANFQKVREAMANLSPEAQGFAAKIVSLGDGFKEMRASAGEGLFPGLSAGMDAAANRVPEINKLLTEYGDILGGIAQRSGDALGSERWDVLFSYLSNTGGPTLNALATSFGNIAHGVVEMLNAFAPLSQGGLDWVADITEDFDKWAGSLEGSEGFNNFAEYVRDVGPQVADVIGAITMALVDIGRAVAPLSGVVLGFLEAFAKAISLIANTPFGPTIMAGVIAWRAMARVGPLVSSGLTGATRNLSNAAVGMTALADKSGKASGAVLGIGKSLGTASRTMTGFRAGLSKLGGTRGALGAAGLAGAATQANKGVGFLMGAMSGAVAGSVFGPWGAAIGGVAGGLIGLAGAASQSKDELSEWDTLAQRAGTSYTEFQKLSETANASITANAGKASQAQKEFAASYDLSGDSVVSANEAVAGGFDSLDAYTAAWKDLGDAGSYVSDEMAENAKNFQGFSDSFSQLSTAFDVGPMDHAVDTGAEMDQVYKQLKPTLDAIGVSQADLNKYAKDGSLDTTIARARAYVQATDSAEAKTDALASALQGLNSDALTTADSAQALATALEAMFQPALDAAKGQIAFRNGIRGLDEAIKNGNAGLYARTQAADDNKAAMIGMVEASLSQAKTDAAAGAGAVKVVNNLERQRNAIRDAGIQAGISQPQMNKFLNEFFKIPNAVKIAFSTPGAENAKKSGQQLHGIYKAIPSRVLTHLIQTGADLNARQVGHLNGVYRKVPRQVVTKMLTDGVNKSNKEIQALGRKYKLTPKQVRTLIKVDAADATKKADAVKNKVKDNDGKTATTKIKADVKQFNTGAASVNKAMGKIDGKTATAKIKVDSGNSLTVISNVQSAMNGLSDKTITVTTRHVSTGTGEATGGWIRGPGTGTSDSIPRMLSNGEFVIPAAAARRIGDQTLQYMRQTGSLPRSARMAHKMAAGGVVASTQGGTLARIAEAGRSERVTPLDRSGFTPAERQMLAMLETKLGGGGGDTYNVHPAPGMNETQLADRVARRVAWNRRRGVGAS